MNDHTHRPVMIPASIRLTADNKAVHRYAERCKDCSAIRYVKWLTPDGAEGKRWYSNWSAPPNESGPAGDVWLDEEPPDLPGRWPGEPAIKPDPRGLESIRDIAYRVMREHFGSHGRGPNPPPVGT